jgi:Polyketide cyclase / dehydrase and lipid transport
MWTAHRAGALLATGLLASASAFAADIQRLEATHDDDRYKLTFEVVLNAERDKVWNIMTDYDRLTRVSKIIVESRVLKKENENRHRVSVTLHACVLIFCKTMNKVVDILARPRDDIVVTGVPALSDFRYSVEHWQVSAENANTRLHYTAEMIPDFYVPPLIGPWMVKYFLKKEITATAIQVEALAGHE